MLFIFLSHASSGKWRKEVTTPGDTPSMNSALGFTATPFLAEIHTRSGRTASDWVTPTRLLKILDPAHTVRCSPLKVCTDSWSAKPVCLAATPISPPPHQVWRRRGSGQLGQAQLCNSLGLPPTPRMPAAMCLAPGRMNLLPRVIPTIQSAWAWVSSTRSLLDCRWRVFEDRCSHNGHIPFQCSVGVSLFFLLGLIDKLFLQLRSI